MDGQVVQDIAELAREGNARIEQITAPGVREDAIPLAVMPQGDGRFSIASVKALVDEYRTAPERRKGTASALTLESFIALVNRHKDGGSAIFADFLDNRPSMTAVVDYHDLENLPRYGEHRIKYVFPLSEEWQAWIGSNKRQMSQVDWAAFIENHMRDLTAPTDQETAEGKMFFEQQPAVPTRIIALSRGLEILVEARVKDVRNLQSGEVELAFEESHKDAGGKTLKIPGLFVISIPIFVDAEPSRFLVRLRYRKNDGKLTWFYDIVRPDLVMRERLLADLLSVRTETALPAFEGKPEA